MSGVRPWSRVRLQSRTKGAPILKSVSVVKGCVCGLAGGVPWSRCVRGQGCFCGLAGGAFVVEGVSALEGASVVKGASWSRASMVTGAPVVKGASVIQGRVRGVAGRGVAGGASVVAGGASVSKVCSWS